MSVKIKDNSKAMMKLIETYARMRLRDAGPVILRAAIRRCPVDTGNLQRSLETKYEGLTLILGSNVHYADRKGVV